MGALVEVPSVMVHLKFQPPPSRGVVASQLRGAVAALFPSNDLFHQHAKQESDGAAGPGRTLYRYPLIQYRWRGDSGFVVGFGDAAESLASVPWDRQPLRLGNREVEVHEADMELSTAHVGLAQQLERYEFLSPWLPFNKQNYEQFRELSPESKQREYDRVLLGNLLAALKGLQIWVEERIYASVQVESTHQCIHKSTARVGVRGWFLTNLHLPPHLGIGAAVSHGFGWVAPRRGGDFEARKSQ